MMKEIYRNNEAVYMENFPYKEETERLYMEMGPENRQRIFGYRDTELTRDFVGFLHCYADLAKLPKDFTVIDIGSYQAVPGLYFREHAAYIAVEPGIPEHAILKQDNRTFYDMCGQDFIKDVLPDLICRGLDLNKTFVICSYVPDNDLRTNIIPGAFPYYRCTYPEKERIENIPIQEKIV